MRRYRNNTVTEGIAVLLPCRPSEQDGVATFLVELAKLTPVRRINVAEFTSARRLNEALNSMEDYEREHFRAVGSLLSALQSQDESALVRARQLVDKGFGLKHASDIKLGIVPAKQDDLEFGRLLLRVFGLQPGQEIEAIQRWSGYRFGPRSAADHGWLLSQLMSVGLAAVRLVLWSSGNRVQPAIYCPDLKAAVYVFLLTKKWGVCPQCGNFFVQKRPDQTFCTIAHREAHRVARWRAVKLAKTRKRGGHNGTRKTR
jgi:hypothetical protein